MYMIYINNYLHTHILLLYGMEMNKIHTEPYSCTNRTHLVTWIVHIWCLSKLYHGYIKYLDDLLIYNFWLELTRHIFTVCWQLELVVMVMSQRKYSVSQQNGTLGFICWTNYIDHQNMWIKLVSLESWPFGHQCSNFSEIKKSRENHRGPIWLLLTLAL